MITSKLKFFGIRFFNPVIRIANRITWRFGRPYRCSGDIAASLINVLRPGMLVVTRTEYLFGNLWIHGYWTHVAMVMPGNDLIEAVGSGVRSVSPNDLLKHIDDWAVFCPSLAGNDLVHAACTFARQATGLKYNFSFRRKFRKYYCSELIYQAFESGSRTCGGTEELTSYGRPYWDKKFIITPDWLVTMPLGWIQVAGALMPAHSLFPAPEHVPFAGRTGEFPDLEPATFHRPAYIPLGTVSQ